MNFSPGGRSIRDTIALWQRRGVIILFRILVLVAGLWLLLSFPKQMITIFALLILVIAFAYYTAQSSRQRDPEQLEISAIRSPEICTDANVPILVRIANKSADRT